MMISVTAVEYRSVIRFLFLRGKNADQIMQELQLAYGDSAPSRTTTYDWIKQFKNGRVSVEDGKSTGRPSNSWLTVGASVWKKEETILKNFKVL